MIKTTQKPLITCLTALAFSLTTALYAAPAYTQEATSAELQAGWKALFDEFSFEIEVSDITALNSSMTGEQLKAMYLGDVANNLDALHKLTADRIEIPSITMRITVPPKSFMTQAAGQDSVVETVQIEVVQKGIVYENIRNGLAQRAYSEEMVVRQPGQVDTSTDIEWKDVRLDYALDWLVGVPAANNDWQQVLSEYTVARQTSKIDPETKIGEPDIFGNCEVNDQYIGAIKAKPLQTSLTALIAAFQAARAVSEEMQKSKASALNDDDEDAEDDINLPPKVQSFIALVITAFDELGHSVEVGVNGSGSYMCQLQVEELAVDFSIGGYEQQGYKADLVFPPSSAFDMKAEFDFGHVSLDQFALKSIDLSPMMETLKKADGDFNEAFFEANVRRLVPHMEGFSIDALDVDVTNPDDGEKIVFKIGGLDLTLGNYIQGIPTKISSQLRDFDSAMPEEEDGPWTALKAAGIDRLRLDYDIDIEWHEADKTITIDQLNLAYKDLFNIETSMVLGNVDKAMFTAKPEILPVLALGGTVKSFTVHIDDYGAIDIFARNMAEENDMPEAAAKGAMAGMGNGMLAEMLGAPELGDAVQALIQSGQALDVTFTAKAEGGVPIGQLVAAQNDPSIISQLMDIEVR